MSIKVPGPQAMVPGLRRAGAVGREKGRKRPVEIGAKIALKESSSSVRQPAILGAIIIDHPSHPGNMIQDQSSSFANQRVLVMPQWLRWCPVESAGALCLGLTFFAAARVACELAASPVALPFPRLAEAWRQVHGHAAAAGSEGIEHGRLPSGCTSGGRLPPLGRSNDRSPPTAMPLYPPH